MNTRLIKPILITLAILCVLTFALGVWGWRYFGQRRSLPFPLGGEPVVARHLYSMASGEIPPPADAPQFHGWRVFADPIAVPPDVAAELRNILSTPSSFTFSDSQCFEPGMAFSFGQGADHVDVLICLLCNRAVFFRGDAQVGRCISEEGNKRLTAVYQTLFHKPPPSL